MLPKVTLVAVGERVDRRADRNRHAESNRYEAREIVVPRNFEIAEEIERMVGRDLTVQADR